MNSRNVDQTCVNAPVMKSLEKVGGVGSCAKAEHIRPTIEAKECARIATKQESKDNCMKKMSPYNFVENKGEKGK